MIFHVLPSASYEDRIKLQHFKYIILTPMYLKSRLAGQFLKKLLPTFIIDFKQYRLGHKMRSCHEIHIS